MTITSLRPLDDLEPAPVSPYEEIELADGHSSIYRRHDNGGGHVALDAQAHSSAYVADTSWVDSGATLRAGVRVGQHCWIERDAQVESGAVLGDHVHLGAGVVVGAGSHLGHHVSVAAGRQLVAASEIADETQVRTLTRDDRARVVPAPRRV
ncbi:transferase [Cellulomonas soli]